VRPVGVGIAPPGILGVDLGQALEVGAILGIHVSNMSRIVAWASIVRLTSDPQASGWPQLPLQYRPMPSRHQPRFAAWPVAAQPGAVRPQQRLADPALLGLAGEAVLEPVQATAHDVLGGRLAVGLHVPAVHPHRGEPGNRAWSAAASSRIRVVRNSVSMPSSARTRSTSASVPW
jgi:hypothetical protein